MKNPAGAQPPVYPYVPSSVFPNSSFVGMSSTNGSNNSAMQDDPSISRRQSVSGALSGHHPFNPYMMPYNYMTFHGQNPYHQTTQPPHHPLVLPHWPPQVIYPQYDMRSVPQQHPVLHSQNQPMTYEARNPQNGAPEPLHPSNPASRIGRDAKDLQDTYSNASDV